MDNGLPLLEISGTPRERGQQHGEAFKEEISTLLEGYFGYFESTSRAHGLEPLTKARMLAIADTYAEPAARYAPDLVQEAQGIAAGAGVAYGEILALNAFLDILDYMSDAFAKGGCTTLMVPGALDGSGALIAQNYDLPGPFPPAAVLLKITAAEAPDTLVYTSTGMLGCAGLNSAGLGVVINNLIPGDAGPGVPYPFVIRQILAGRQIGDAIDAVVSHPRSSGMNYVLCDRNGEIYDLETTAKDYEVLCPFTGPMAHTNHYVAQRLKPLERRDWSQRGQSIARWGRGNRLLGAADRPDAAGLRHMLADHVNEPLAICRHDELVHGESCGQTICGIVLEPPTGRAWIARGPTCQHEWVEYSLF